MSDAWVDPYFERSMQREESMTIPCPFCREPTGSPCKNKATGEDLAYIPAHVQRLREART